MPKEAGSLIWCILFTLQTTLSTLPSRASFASDATQETRPVYQSKAIWSKILQLDADNQPVYIASLEIDRIDKVSSDGLAFVKVDCFSTVETPPLAVEEVTYGVKSRLINITGRQSAECASFGVAVASIAPAMPASRPQEAPDLRLAVSVHHSGKPQSDAVGNPAVFVFNPVRGNWTEAQANSPATPDPQKAYATLTEHHQRIIVGVIAQPSELQVDPASNAPQSLTGPLEQVSASEGYLAINTIEPDNKGAYEAKLPMLLRPSRGPGPSFSISYSSEGAAGVLGRGWDLSVSAIEVRGPAPIYHPEFETEDYLLDGMGLIPLDGQGQDIAPLDKGGPIVRRVKSVRFFRLRNSSNPLIVRRYGDSPSSYFWEVWDPNSHVTRLYGGKFTANNSAPVLEDDGNGLLRARASFSDGVSREVIGEWGLTQEFDNQPARSGSSYRYYQAEKDGGDCLGDLGKTECRSALRLMEVRYSRAFALPDGKLDPSGETQVVFDWDYREDEKRHNSDGRLGFLRAYQHWLRAISVKYRPDGGNLWLASDDDTSSKGQVIFSKHTFELTNGDHACMNYDVMLAKYKVDGNPRFDGVTSSQEQVFTFDYDGDRYQSSDNGVCDRKWEAVRLGPADMGNLPKDAPSGTIGFPKDLLKTLNLGLLAEQSFIGTGRIEEAGASAYIGVGPAGDTSVKPISGGYKGGTNFTKSETNSTLVDVTGDGIDDIVTRQGDRLRYCGGQRDPDTRFVTYPETRCGWIEGIADLARSSTSTFSAGGEVNAYGSIFAGVGFNRSRNDSFIYFTDRDADGLVDLAAYGQIYYGQGETEEGGNRIVRFLPNRALIPPLPGGERSQELSSHLPRDLRTTILEIESRLEVTARRLSALDYSQITLAWEAPLDGEVSLAGLFERGEVDPASVPLSGVDPAFGPEDFEDLADEVDAYKEYAYSCEAWPEKDFCHRPYSDPYEAQYTRPADEFTFVRVFDGRLRIALYQHRNRAVVPCLDTVLPDASSFEIGQHDFHEQCRRPGSDTKEIDVRTGDVLYLTYSVHPHFAKWVRPRALIRYVEVDNDPSFAIAKSGDQDRILGLLPCNWKLDSGASLGKGCALSQLSPYEFELRAGAAASAPNRAVELAPGRERTFEGHFLIPQWLTQSYAVYFDILAGRVAKPTSPGVTAAETPGPVPADTLKRVYRLDVSARCAGQSQTCSITLAPTCDEANPAKAECDAFVRAQQDHFAVASRLVVQHKVEGAEIAVRNVDTVLQDAVWTRPPHIRTILSKLDPEFEGPQAPGAEIERYSLVYLPISMGQEDINYFRIEAAAFDNPDVDLNEGDPQPDIINFGTMMDLERETVRFTRIRQTLELCRFADEILTYLHDSFTEHAAPFAQDYLGYWVEQRDRHSRRCEAAEKEFAKAKFTGQDGPDEAVTDRLNLPLLLRNLPHEERVASAETLLQRVLASFDLGDQFLTDDHKLTRRGYRLPLKVNPLDCDMLGRTGVPVDAPIIDRPGRSVPDCAYRLLANFAMEDFERLIGKSNAANLRTMLAPLSSSTAAAFRVELAATINGRPVAFRELSGEQSGNDACTPASKNSCIGTYGTTGDDKTGVKEYFYPKGIGAGTGANPDDPTAGDVLQRVTTNKRPGRAVAFSNSIMSSKVPPACERDFPLYATGWQMEAKQDCLINRSDVPTEAEKYVGVPSYSIAYEISENNHFVGRNRVVEFRANPLDIVEFQIRLGGVEQSIEVTPGNPQSVARGAFSVLNGGANNGLTEDKHLISRSPSDILPNPSDALPLDVNTEYNCPRAPSITEKFSNRPLPTTCRPWSRLGWAELLLGAEYRTYSDAQKTRRTDEYSIKRRREILRLQPEIEVRADRYYLEHTMSNKALLVSELGSNANVTTLLQALDEAELPLNVTAAAPKEHLVFHSRDPNVSKTGGAWALVGSRAPNDGSLNNLPTFPQLRFGALEQNPPKDREDAYKASSDACGDEADPDIGGCERHLTPNGERSLALDGHNVFALEHRFVGPVDGGPGRDGAPEVLVDAEATGRTGIGQCSAAQPNSTANCWMGPDDTVFLEEAIVPLALKRPDLHSVSALVGFERPPLAQFLFEFDSYKRLACLDPVIKEPDVAPNTCPPPAPLVVSEAPALEYPSRPNPPATNIPMYAPVKASRSRSVSRNVGALLYNRNSSKTELDQTTAFLDVNGDGYPDVVAGGRAELTSPIGLSRSDWWHYYRVEENMPSLAAEGHAQGLNQFGRSVSSGAGVGLSPSTFAVFKQKGPSTKESGSPDAVLDPSFSLDEEHGYDESFTELRDFNGDGLADQLTGGAVSQGLKLALNAGGSMVGAPGSGMVTAGGAPVSTVHYNTNSSSGFGVRLGFSVESGSYGAGMGLAHRASRSVAALMDFTGDGRPDIVVPNERQDGGGNVLVFPNLGNGFGKARWHSLTDYSPQQTGFTETTLVDAGGFYTYGFNAWFLKISYNVGTKLTRGQTRELLNFRDVNGDGFPDLAMTRGTFLSLDGNEFAGEVHYNPEARYHLLTGITNPSGSRYLLGHALYGNEGAANGRPVWALTEVARYDGFEPLLAEPSVGPLADDGQDVLLTRYRYEKGYFNRAERRFYGFERRVATSFGCDLAMTGQLCLGVLDGKERLTETRLGEAGYRKLQIVDQTFSNKDFLTQGVVLSESVQGFDSRAPNQSGDKPPAREGPQVVSASHYGYTIDHLSHHTAVADPAACGAPLPTSLLSGSWDPKAQSVGSKLPPLWDGSSFVSETPLLGQDSLCGSIGGPECAKELKATMCRAGFMREQQAFWAQQSGSVRHRLESLEVFAGDVSPEEASAQATARLRSGVAFDHDQWGQVRTFNSIGEATPEWVPGAEGSAHAKIVYASRQGLNAAAAAPANGYPLLALAEEIRVFGGGWPGQDGPSPTLRVRQAIHTQDGRGNLTDVCTYPSNGLTIPPKLCDKYKETLRRHVGDGYSTLQGALRATYEEIGDLPKGEAEFGAIVHHQLTAYDEFGNLTHAVSPLTGNKEWIERRFNYAGDPFRRSATTTALTRCVEEVAGAGMDTAGIEAETDRCTLALDVLPESVRRTALTHQSTARIDTHTGAVAETTDINRNSILLDFDRWGRLRLIARGWGNAPRENRTFEPQLRLAMAKSVEVTQAPEDVPPTDRWRILALADYERVGHGLLRSNLRRFDPSDSYSGLLNRGKSTRESAMFADGNGRPIQTIREADVCVGIPDHLANGAKNATKDGKPALPTTGLAERCQSVATAVVTPASAIDALGRDLLSFEPYAHNGAVTSAPSSGSADSYRPPRFDKPAGTDVRPSWLSRSTYDGAGRPTLVQSRLALEGAAPTDGRVRGGAQYRYRIVAAADSGKPRRLARFEALILSPRCSVSAAWSDARGLTRTVFEQQARLYTKEAQSDGTIAAPSFLSDYKRDYALSWGDCEDIENVAREIDPAIEQSATVEWPHASGSADAASPQPVRVSYAYDPMQQLTEVSYPLAGRARASISVRYDMIGRMTELHEPNAGCTSYHHDPMNLLVAVRGFRFEPEGRPCGTTSRVANEKKYRYSADRLVEMAYRSLEEQGGADDARDTVHFYYDRYPHAQSPAELLEASRYVPNDDANRRFVDVTGRDCDNCIGQVAIVTDRTGARSFAYNALGLARREVRSIVAPLKDAGLTHSSGQGEAYLPEVASHEIENSYTAFGDLVQESFVESAPSNPHRKCVEDGIQTCLARFTIGRRYAPDGALAELLFNGRPLISAAQDALGRPAVRWTADGTATGYRYDGKDLRLNQLATLTAGVVGDGFLPVQVNGFQYDGGGNVLAYTNRAILEEEYESAFGFGYDAVNRLAGFAAEVRKRVDRLKSHGSYAYDEGHRFVRRELSIEGLGAQRSSLVRDWTYHYNDVPGTKPPHAPERIQFRANDTKRDSVFAYDDLGRMTRIGAPPSEAKLPLGLLTNRAMSWDAEGRLIRARGVADDAAETNTQWLREDYIYDAGGNRTLRIHRPRVDAAGKPVDEEKAATATVYMTPFYAKTLDRRGTVQLAQGSLPGASFEAPSDGSETPLVTYVHSDLAVGSMTASVTAYGEAQDAGAIVIARREYSPYGLELSADWLADTGRPGAAPLSVFHGKELDRVTNFSSFGARSYSRDIGTWLSPDPMTAVYVSNWQAGSIFAAPNLSSYAYAHLRPTMASDPDGREPVTASLTAVYLAAAAATAVVVAGNIAADQADDGRLNGSANILTKPAKDIRRLLDFMSTELIPAQTKIDTLFNEDATSKDTVKVKDLAPTHSEEVAGRRDDLEKLSDDELLEAVRNPKEGNPILIKTDTGKVHEGNRRTWELRKRANDPSSKITPETEIPVQRYTPDKSHNTDFPARPRRGAK